MFPRFFLLHLLRHDNTQSAITIRYMHIIRMHIAYAYNFFIYSNAAFSKVPKQPWKIFKSSTIAKQFASSQPHRKATQSLGYYQRGHRSNGNNIDIAVLIMDRRPAALLHIFVGFGLDSDFFIWLWTGFDILDSSL